MDDHPTALFVFAFIGISATCYAAMVAAYTANFRLIAWWNRRRARTTEECQ